MRAGLLTSVLLAAVFSSFTAAQKPAPAAPPPKKNPYLKTIAPWPTPEELTKRRQNAESLPLFSSEEIFNFTIVTDFKALNKDRDPESKKRFPGELRFPGEGGAQVTMPVQLGARGHVRRMSRTCDYVPLRIDFPKEGRAGTPFARQEALKLVVQCVKGGDYEQFLLKEYLAYRMFNVLTHKSFRARLAKVTYVDHVSGQTTGTRYGMFVEDDGDVAKRMEGRTTALPRLLFKDVDTDTLMPMMIFQFMIGNTDFSIHALHNVKLVERPDKSIHPIPYDFDISGLVHPPYAIPDKQLMITSVRDRLYRGPCRKQEQIDPYVAHFVAKKDLLKALPDAIPGMDKEAKQDVRSYLDDFYSAIKTTKDARRLFVECKEKSTM